MPIVAPPDSSIAEAIQKLMEDGIDAGTYVVLEADPSRNYYIQFAVQGGRLFCECVSNQYLDPENQLSAEQLSLLANLGWREPETATQNWFRTYRPSAPADYAAIVKDVRNAFATVYRIAPDAEIEMTCSWDGQVFAPETSIRFRSEGHRSTYDKVATFAHGLFEGSVTLDVRRPILFIQHGSTVTSVAVNPIEIHSSIIDLYSLLVREITVTPELMRWLLAANYRARLGSLSLDGDGNVVLKQSVVGDTITEEEFAIVLGAFVDQADELDDGIVDKFGGYTARDWALR